MEKYLKRKDITIHQAIFDTGLNDILIAKSKKDNRILAVKKIRTKEISWIELKLKVQYLKLRLRFNDAYPIPSLLPKSDQSEVDNEVNCLKLARHENVLEICGYFRKGNFSYIITEYCVFSVGNLLKERSKMPMLEVPLALYITVPILNAIHHIHSKGLIHMDIKPDNIMFTSEGIPKLIDFGLSRKLEDDVETSEVGTYGFIAPEIYRKEKIDQKVDLFSFGVTMINFAVKHPCKMVDDDIGPYFVERIPKILKTHNITVDALVRMKYSLFNDNIIGEFGEYIAVAASFVTYLPQNRSSTEKALQTDVIKKYNEAWDTRNETYKEGFELLEQQAKRMNCSLSISSKFEQTIQQRKWLCSI